MAFSHTIFATNSFEHFADLDPSLADFDDSRFADFDDSRFADFRFVDTNLEKFANIIIETQNPEFDNPENKNRIPQIDDIELTEYIIDKAQWVCHDWARGH